MNRATILRLAKAKWGKTALVEENPHVPDPETRAIIRAELEKVKAQKPAPPPEVLAYNKRLSEWNSQVSLLRSRCVGLGRYRVLVPLGWGGREVKGHGDTWEQAALNAKLIEPETAP